ncbi:hypothetical protein [Streptomyces sp. SID5468]|uniref:hypothetical protein n=1 Tax=Streptomyces sp. SID5468 TaxID=2690295 RepID=UPI0031FEB26E
MLRAAREGLGGIGVDRYSQQRLSPFAVVADFELEGVVQLALGFGGQRAESPAEFGQEVEKRGVGVGGRPLGGFLAGELLLESGLVAFQGGEAFPDGLPVGRGGLWVLVAGVGQLVHEACLLCRQLGDLLAQRLGLSGGDGLGVRRALRQLGGEEFSSSWSEDAGGEEVVDGADEGFLADPDTLGVGGVPGCVAVVARLGLAGVEGQPFAAFARTCVVRTGRR